MRQDGRRPAIALGFALGGFFDGILLHQILQWHHLLSLVAAIGDLRRQVLWDGWFHAAMYLVAGVGLVGLWRAQRRGAAPAGGALLGALLVGFGLWHMVDGVLSHWILGIHRIRLDTPRPLLWDLGWFAGFGVLPAVVGALLLRGASGGPGRAATATALVALLAVTLAAGGWALRPAPGQPLTAVVFREGLSGDAALRALEGAGAEVVWGEPQRGLVLVDLAQGGGWRLYRHGAILVGGAGLPAGCFGWST